MTNELNTMIEARKKIEYCVKTCDDIELTEHGMDAVVSYTEAFSAWARSIGKERGPKKVKAHEKILDHIYDGFEYADDAELVDLVWEYLPKLARASKAMVKAYQAEGIKSVA